MIHKDFRNKYYNKQILSKSRIRITMHICVCSNVHCAIIHLVYIYCTYGVYCKICVRRCHIQGHVQFTLVQWYMHKCISV